MRIIRRHIRRLHRGNKHLLAAVFTIVFVMSTASPQAVERTAVVLQGLDKITARISKFSAELGAPAVFGTLEITARACHKKPPEEPPESAAFLEIREKREGEPVDLLFSGWMFASTPGLSALQHPVYDVWVLDCAILEENSDSNG